MPPSRSKTPRHQLTCRQALTTKDHADIVAAIRNNSDTRTGLARLYGVTRQAICAIEKRGDLVLAEHKRQLELGLTGKEYKRRVQTRKCKTKQVDEAVNTWLGMVADFGASLTLSGHVICAKALEFAVALGVYGFQASPGWLRGFTKRYNVASRVRSGDSGNYVVTDTVLAEVENIRVKLDGVDPAHIWNLDEAALFYRTLCARSYAQRSKSRKKSTTAKDRFTITICCSAIGTKLPLQLIGKAGRPRNLLPGPIATNYGLYYDNSRKAWQTSDTLKRYIELLNIKAQDEDADFVVLVDNASSHVKGIGELCLSGYRISLASSCN
ncbi:tigger transposable element derived 6-like [Achlya hypogyna]|uniref:Tigger transposable element derived 6-like n=1 Tax=Achlya hypogyna TaxID=1202772 RepID=A0A1V9YHZ2_ACHHY|nr:tigger transposable element derived 6-like [Achlya hypogyna]